ncbi:DNA ligase 4 [Plodia interpunctella]|uniref:DNA ligase 4 n=1 Tax=Plodia interpunctella TaxID=58824 RepID=UPI0023678BCE|nr:DNA ligase 4 [Plodia interpunctella]XP_053614948.1 DNA ligase 4 [Plodia interpunctella]XP_053614957.1 DNA ligase 4 [Plodia interpunctella]XP_053614966.1 DNA ligase 4 [Plodia interpunctella]
MESKEVVPANSIAFADLCSVLEKLRDVQKNHKKQQNKTKSIKQAQGDILKMFLNECKLAAAKVTEKKDSSLFNILRLLLPACDRERSPYNMKESKLGVLLVKVLAISDSMDAQKLKNYRSAADSNAPDFASVAYFVIKKRFGEKPGCLDIGKVNAILDKIAMAEVGNKGPALHEAFKFAIDKLSPKQFEWFLRMILKDMKLSMGTDRILAAFHPDAPSYNKECNNLMKVCEMFDDGNARPVEMGVQIFYPVCPMRCERLDVTETNLHLSADKTYIVENKFDGERFQIHMKDGVYEYFSRRGHSYSDNYGKTHDSGLLTPHLKDCFIGSVSSFIIDGEMMGWHKYSQTFKIKGEPFDVKKITETSSLRPCFIAYDVLMYNGKSLVGPAASGGLPLSRRLAILDDMFDDVTGVILHSKREVHEDRSVIRSKLNEAIEKQEEGIVVKDASSYYLPSSTSGGWYKIKPEYTKSTMNDMDVVVIGADEAANKRQGRASSFHVACADVTTPGSPPTRWLSIGRVSSGLSFEDLRTLCAALERNWVPLKQREPPASLVFGKTKPDFWILPEHSVVLQVRATEAVRSGDSGAGHLLRFPRVERLRADKPVGDAMTLIEFNTHLSSKSNVSKLATTAVSADQMELEQVKITRKRKIKEEPKVAPHFRVVAAADVEADSKALLDRKVCVLSSDEDCSIEELDRIVRSHSGIRVANVGPDTWCAVVGKSTALALRTIKSQEVDVTTTTWLRSLEPSPLPCRLEPLDLLAMKWETRKSFSIDFDCHGDSYTKPSDLNSLKRCFDKMDSEPKVYLTQQEMLTLDKELFGDTNPFSFLRPCYMYFTKHHSVHSIRARMFGANICRQLCPDVTHVVIAKSSKTEEIDELRRMTDASFVTEEWLEKCLAARTILEEM